MPPKSDTSFALKLRNINRDFSVEPKPQEIWSAMVKSDDELCTVLNRIAIATTQAVVYDFPEVEITHGTRRATITSVNGELFFSDLHSSSRKNLKVVPDEVVQLMQGRPLEQVFSESEAADEDDAPEALKYEKRKLGKRSKVAFLVLLSALFILSVYSVFNTLNSRSLLVDEPNFTPLSNEGSRELLLRSSGVYLTEIREGGMVVELKQSGDFRRFNVWRSPRHNRFVLVEVESLKAVGGRHEGGLAILAGKFHLLELENSETVRLHGILLRKFNGTLADIGPIVESIGH